MSMEKSINTMEPLSKEFLIILLARFETVSRTQQRFHPSQVSWVHFLNQGNDFENADLIFGCENPIHEQVASKLIF